MWFCCFPFVEHINVTIKSSVLPCLGMESCEWDWEKYLTFDDFYSSAHSMVVSLPFRLRLFAPITFLFLSSLTLSISERRVLSGRKWFGNKNKCSLRAREQDNGKGKSKLISFEFPVQRPPTRLGRHFFRFSASPDSVVPADRQSADS